MPEYGQKTGRAAPLIMKGQSGREIRKKKKRAGLSGRETADTIHVGSMWTVREPLSRGKGKKETTALGNSAKGICIRKRGKKSGSRANEGNEKKKKDQGA